ncbi:MAG TPA: PaaI family thioesterase [Stellaceae bacterium]|nr:PaaI family thioesterase [Stellaceae bacterium]
MNPLDFLKSRSLPFAEMMGIVFVAADKDKVVAELEVTPKLCTRPTTIHGGALMAFADTLGAAGTVLNLPDGMTTTTLESKTNFIAGAPIGTRLIGETTPVHRGRRTQVWTTRIRTAEGRLVAIVTQTQMVLAAST